MNSHLYSHLFIILIPFISCNNIKYHSTSVTIKVINELQDCEENNLHYKVVKVLKGAIPSNINRDIILPVLSKHMNNERNNNLLFPEFRSQKILIDIKGYYSKRGHNDHSSGCLGSPLFKIEQILEVSEVDSSINM